MSGRKEGREAEREGEKWEGGRRGKEGGKEGEVNRGRKQELPLAGQYELQNSPFTGGLCPMLSKPFAWSLIFAQSL